MSWNRLEGFKRTRCKGKVTGWYINGQKVEETVFKDIYCRKLEKELDAAHAKLAAIYEII